METMETATTVSTLVNIAADYWHTVYNRLSFNTFNFC